MRLLLVLLAVVRFGSATERSVGDHASELCSMIPLPTGKDASLTYLLGSASPDTLAAGMGTVELGSGPGHWGAGRLRTVYGQVVQVHRFGGADSARIARAFDARGSREVVLVPWDYDPACQPVPWGGSARWSPPGLEGAYTVTPRPAGHWVDGRPTFDVYAADLEPYPHGRFFQRGYRGTDRLRTEPSLTPGEFFDLYRILPSRGEARDPASIAAAIERWESAHPAARERYPAPEIFQYVRWMGGHR